MDKFQVSAASSSSPSTGLSIDTSMGATIRSLAANETNRTSEKTLEAPASASGKDATSPASHHRDRSSPLREALYKLGGGGGFTPNTTMNTPKTPSHKERGQGQGEAEAEEEEEFEDTQAEFDFSHVQFSSPTHKDQDKDEETEGEGFYFSAQEGEWISCPD